MSGRGMHYLSSSHDGGGRGGKRWRREGHHPPLLTDAVKPIAVLAGGPPRPAKQHLLDTARCCAFRWCVCVCVVYFIVGGKRGWRRIWCARNETREASWQLETRGTRRKNETGQALSQQDMHLPFHVADAVGFSVSRFCKTLQLSTEERVLQGGSVLTERGAWFHG
jgi:hypothetical protein